MKEEENVDEMFAIFDVIFNELKSLGKSYSTRERVRKFLRCIPNIWRPMVIVIS